VGKVMVFAILPLVNWGKYVGESLESKRAVMFCCATPVTSDCEVNTKEQPVPRCYRLTEGT